MVLQITLEKWGNAAIWIWFLRPVIGWVCSVPVLTLTPKKQQVQDKPSITCTKFIKFHCHLGSCALGRRGGASICGWGNILTLCALPVRQLGNSLWQMSLRDHLESHKSFGKREGQHREKNYRGPLYCSKWVRFMCEFSLTGSLLPWGGKFEWVSS